MGIKSLLGGEINYKAIDKHYQKEYKKWAEKQKFINDSDKTYFSLLNKIGPENFVKKVLEAAVGPKLYETEEKSIKDFLSRYPDAIPP